MRKSNAVERIKEALAMDTMLLVIQAHKARVQSLRRDQEARERQEAHDLTVAHARMGVYLAEHGICQPVYREVW